MIIVPKVSKLFLLDTVLDTVDTYCHLYVTEVSLGDDTTLADFVEPSWSGYVPQRVNTWTPALLVGEHATSTADPVEWVRGAIGDPENVYGYYLTNGPAGELLWAEGVCGRLFLEMAFDGQVAVVWPKIRLTAERGEPCNQGGGVRVWGEQL